MRSHSKKERIMAWIGIGALLLLYIISFILGVFGSQAAFGMFLASLLATFFIPTMIYLFQMFMKRAQEKRTTAVVDDENEIDG